MNLINILNEDDRMFMKEINDMCPASKASNKFETHEDIAVESNRIEFDSHHEERS